MAGRDRPSRTGGGSRRFAADVVESTDHTITAAQARFVSWVSEVLVDIVVLNLFVEFAHTVVIDSFYISVLTAVLLKLMVDAVKGLENRVSAFLAAKPGPAWKAVRFLAVWLILFLSKFVILEIVDVVFGSHVELGGFIEIVAIVITMLVANAALLAVYRRLGAIRPVGT
jgi:hypothetical protein